jgi:hypothetical protein
MKKLGAWLFDGWGLGLAGILLAGSLFFLVTAWLNIRNVPPVGPEPGVQAFSHVDVFFGREVFLASHLWLAAALYLVFRTRGLFRESRVRALLLIFVIVLVAGHFVAWQAQQKGIGLGVPFW